MIGRVVVLPEYRRQGIGTMVVSGCEDWAEELGYSKVVVESRVNKVEVYEQMLYEICGEAADGVLDGCFSAEGFSAALAASSDAGASVLKISLREFAVAISVSPQVTSSSRTFASSFILLISLFTSFFNFSLCKIRKISSSYSPNQRRGGFFRWNLEKEEKWFWKLMKSLFWRHK